MNAENVDWISRLKENRR